MPREEGGRKAIAPPPKFWAQKIVKKSSCWKNVHPKFGGEKKPFWEIKSTTEILSTQLEICSACQKTATFCPAYFLRNDALALDQTHQIQSQ